MSIRGKVLSLVASMFVCLVVLTLLVEHFVTEPAFALLERKRAERDLERTLEALQRDIDLLDNQVNDWAAWDESYRFVDDRNQKFIDENLVSESFANSHLNLICYLNAQAEVIWGEARESGSLAPIEIPQLLDRLRRGDAIAVHRDVNDNHKGIILTERGPMIAVSRPVITTRREGPVRGSLLMGRLLSQKEIVGLAERTRVSLNTWVLGSDAAPSEFVLAKAASPHQSSWLVPVNSEVIHAYAVLNDFYGKPLMLFRVVVPRDISQEGALVSRIATWSSVIGGMALVLGLWMMLKTQIVSPLKELAHHAVRVGRLDDLNARLNSTRQDEIGTLAREFDAMVERLAESRDRVAEAAQFAGMARVATDTLHNVGNALNSANCSLELLQERRRATKLDGLDRAASLFTEQQDRLSSFFSEDARGPQLVKYIISVSSHLQREKERDADDMERLREALHHIRDLVRAQQASAVSSRFTQTLNVSDLCEGTLRLLAHELEGGDVHVIRDFSCVPKAEVDKSRLSQVLLNFAKNAWQSLSLKTEGPRTLTMRARREGDDNLRIEVEDDGVGFDPSLAQRLFQHGFTTKSSGHGFGLHFCAIAATEMGGFVEARSDGPGRGATFAIVLPHVFNTNARPALVHQTS
jgi:two-component system NtrC family sensor kinase